MTLRTVDCRNVRTTVTEIFFFRHQSGWCGGNMHCLGMCISLYTLYVCVDICVNTYIISSFLFCFWFFKLQNGIVFLVGRFYFISLKALLTFLDRGKDAIQRRFFSLASTLPKPSRVAVRTSDRLFIFYFLTILISCWLDVRMKTSAPPPTPSGCRHYKQC